MSKFSAFLVAFALLVAMTLCVFSLLPFEPVTFIVVAALWVVFSLIMVALA